MDNLLLPLLEARDEHEHQQCRAQLLTIHVAPIIRQVLRQRLGLYVSADGVNKHNHDAEDLYQQAMTRMVEVLHAEQRSLLRIENFDRYVGRVVSNICVDFLRSKYPARAREQQLESWDDQVVNSHRSMRSLESDVEAHEVLRRLWRILKRLPAKQRDAFVVRFQDQNGRDLITVLLAAGIVDWKDLAEGLRRSVTDVARLWTQLPMDTATAAIELHTSRDNVYKWRYRALQKLKRELE